jgi:hypothetical protein
MQALESENAFRSFPKRKSPVKNGTLFHSSAERAGFEPILSATIINVYKGSSFSFFSLLMLF